MNSTGPRGGCWFAAPLLFSVMVSAVAMVVMTISPALSLDVPYQAQLQAQVQTPAALAPIEVQAPIVRRDPYGRTPEEVARARQQQYLGGGVWSGGGGGGYGPGWRGGGYGPGWHGGYGPGWRGWGPSPYVAPPVVSPNPGVGKLFRGTFYPQQVSPPGMSCWTYQLFQGYVWSCGE